MIIQLMGKIHLEDIFPVLLAYVNCIQIEKNYASELISVMFAVH